MLTDLLEGGLAPEDRAAVLLSDAETADAAEAALPLTRWHWDGEVIAAQIPEDATHVFFVTDGRGNPVDQVEAFRAWVVAQNAEIARVLCVVDCQLAEKNAGLLPWFEACVHFSDVVLLNRREGVENKWLSDFQTHFKKQFIPALFELVKANRVKNPALILQPEARRVSHIFDEEQDYVFTDASGEEIDEQDESSDEEEIEATLEEDPYFVRDAALRRVKKIPDIRKYLGGVES